MASQALDELDTKDKERGAIAKNQSITSKNLHRLQSEMQEWTIEKLMEYYEDQSNPSYYRTEALIIAQEKERESE